MARNRVLGNYSMGGVGRVFAVRKLTSTTRPEIQDYTDSTLDTTTPTRLPGDSESVSSWVFPFMLSANTSRGGDRIPSLEGSKSSSSVIPFPLGYRSVTGGMSGRMAGAVKNG